MIKPGPQFKIKIYFALLVSFLFVLLNFDIVYGADLFFFSDRQLIKTGDYFQVDLYLNPNNENINVIDGKIIIPEDLLSVLEIIDGDSIVNLWIKKPIINNGKVVFSGMIPGGFKGVIDPFKEGYQPGKILSLILVAKNNGQGFIDLENMKVLLNDGLGTEAKVTTSHLQFEINPEAAGSTGLLPIKDPDPPESFEPLLARDPNIFNNKWFLVFSAQDKGSGIARYEIQETKNKRPGKDWIETQSPYLLKDQRLNSYIYLKAIDKANNERIVTISPRYPIVWYKNYTFWIIIILGLVCMYLLGFISKKKLLIKNITHDKV